jgi:tRNA(Glu) U13 pseudouridine synthase TruD
MYQELVEKEFHLMDKDSFQPKQKGLWDLPGAYRLVLTLPKHVTCSTGHYSAADAPIIKGEDLGGTGEHKGALVSFALPSSSYATMALREIMDQPTRS